MFDISTPTNPTYVAGRDASGSSGGTGLSGIFSLLVVHDDYLYVGGEYNTTACSQSAGSAIGCELKVFDISTPSSPTYTAGRDADGSDDGTYDESIYTIAYSGSTLYLGKTVDTTACSQSAGSAEGCELMVFDISNPDSPTYVAGRDVDGSKDGTGGEAVWSIYDLNGSLFVGKSGDSTACSQSAGSAIGCELMVFDVTSDLLGNMNGTNAFYDLRLDSYANFENNASTTNVVVNPNSTLSAPALFTISGNFTNNGVFEAGNGEVILSGSNQSLLSLATTTFHSLTKETTSAETLTFSDGGTYVTTGILTLTGSSGNLLSLRSSSSTGEWYIDPQATTTVEYLDVQDSNNINVTTITCENGCVDSGNNTNWTISVTFGFLGTLYTDAGVTTAGSGKTIKVAVGTSTPSIHSATTDGSGNWEITGIPEDNLSSATPFIIWLDGDTNDATTLAMGYVSGASFSNIPLYYDHTVVHASSSSDDVDIEDFTFYDNSDDSDILYTVTGTSTTVFSSFLINQGTFISASTTLSVGGDFKNNGGFDVNGGQVVIDNDREQLEYLAGKDARGLLGAYATNDIKAMVASGDYLYVGKTGDTTACSQTAGSADGCELMVFDISSSTSPVYVAGRDADGSSSGTEGVDVLSLATEGDYLYVGKNGNATACSQTTGSAEGCEIMIFDISSSTNPVYTAGLDKNGLANGTSSSLVYDLEVANGHLYVGGSGEVPAASGFPTVESTSSDNSGGNQTSTSITMPSGVTTGDLLIVFFTKDGSASPTGITGTGWTTINSSDPGFVNMRIYWKVADGSDTLTVNHANEATAYVVYRISGHDADNTDVADRELNIGYSPNPDPPLLNPVDWDTEDTLWISVFNWNGDRSVSSWPTNYSSNQVTDRYANSQGTGIAVSTYESASASQDPSTASIGSAEFWGAITLAVRPEQGGGSGGVCSQVAGSAGGCELLVFDVSSSTNPIFVAGRDADGSGSGSDSIAIKDMVVYEDNLYVGKLDDTTACSQTAGSAIGCELMVFNISSSTNPVYVAGRDSGGDNSGTDEVGINSLAVKDSYLYVGKFGSTIACSQTAGSAPGCELMVFDISSTTNPTYVAGRDSGGDSSGTDSQTVYEMVVFGDTIYIGKQNNATACSQTAGSAEGCEVIAFDISSSTNPTYVVGRDVSGDDSGTGNKTVWTIEGHNGYLYVGKEADATACSQIAGSAVGCEIMIFDPMARVEGDLVASNGFGDLEMSGYVRIEDNASTTDFTVSSNSVSVTPAVITVSGDFTNNDIFSAYDGEVILTGTSQSLLSSATTTFYSLTKEITSTDTLTFSDGGSYIITDTLTLSGADSNLLSLRSSSSTGEWYIDPRSTVTVEHLDVQDSNNINVTTIICSTGCVDSGNNTNWSIGDLVSMISSDDYHFYVGQASTTLGQITISETTSSANITSANDLRIAIATTTTDFRFSTDNTTLTFGGNASGKVNSTVSYEDNGATLVIDITGNFSEGDTITVDGIEVGSFATISSTAGQFTAHTDGDINGDPASTDTKTINITGNVALDDHTAGQVDNQFNFQNKTDEAMFVFKLTPNSENATITDMVFTLSGVQNLDTGEFNTLRLYRDNDSDGELDGGDTLLDNSGIMTINGQHGAITFSDDFVITAEGDYLLIGDTTSVDKGDAVVISLPTGGVTAVGITSEHAPVIVGTIDKIQHIRNGAKGGSSGRTTSAPAGDSVETGGGSGGGGGAGEEEDGENIASDPDFLKATSTGDPHNEWTNPENAYDSDGSYATASGEGLRQSYAGFNFNIPGTNTIEGIEVKLDVSGTTAAGTIDVALSWNGGSSYTTGKATPTLSGTDIVYTVGGNTDTWGRGWTSGEFSTDNFQIRVTADPGGNTLRLDALEIRVHHQAGGGGGGGGGRI